jgi:hypothetical protein
MLLALRHAVLHGLGPARLSPLSIPNSKSILHDVLYARAGRLTVQAVVSGPDSGRGGGAGRPRAELRAGGDADDGADHPSGS